MCPGDWCRLPGTDAYTAPPPFDPSSTLVTYVNDGLSGGGYCGPRGGRANADLSQCAFGAALVHNEPIAWHASGIGPIYKSTIGGCPYKSWAIYACFADNTQTTLVPDGCECTYTADDCPAARPNLDTTFYPSGDVCTSEVAPIALPLNPTAEECGNSGKCMLPGTAAGEDVDGFLDQCPGQVCTYDVTASYTLKVGLETGAGYMPRTSFGAGWTYYNHVVFAANAGDGVFEAIIPDTSSKVYLRRVGAADASFCKDLDTSHFTRHPHR